MKRREFIAALGSAFAVSPLRADTMPVIGFLDSRSSETVGNRLRGFRQGLGEQGYVEGRNVTVEYRWAENQLNRLSELASDLVHQRVNVIVAGGGQPVNLAAKAATTTIPVLFLSPQDPVKVGLVTSLARPSGNLTGVNFFNAELAAKQFELLHEMLPNIRRVAVLVDPAAEATTTMALHDLETAARASGMQIDVLKAVDSREIDKAFDGIARDHLDGLFVSQSPFFNLTTRSIDPIGSPQQYPHDLPGT